MNPLPLASGKPTLILILAISAFGLLVAIYLARYVLAKQSGSLEMQKLSEAIQDGAEAYLDQQNRTVAGVAIVLALTLYMAYISGKDDSQLAVRMTISFLFGAIASVASGFAGMWASTRTSTRVAAAARSGVAEAMQLALRGGAVTGVCMTAASLFGLGILFAFFDGLNAPETVPRQIMAFALGAGVVALFVQLSGWIYARAAQLDSPASIARLVADHVVDCAGCGVDIFQSIAAQNVGAMLLGVTLYPAFGWRGVLFPLFLSALGLLCSVAGVFSVSMKKDEDPMAALKRGFYLSSGLALGGLSLAVFLLLGGNLWLFAAGVVGILTSVACVLLTNHPGGAKFRLLSALTLMLAMLAAYFLGAKSAAGGWYGMAIAAMGMLSNAAYVLALSSFAAITANADAIGERSVLDEAGKTSRALTRVYSLGSTALLAVLLIAAYFGEIRLLLAEKLQKPFEEIPFTVDIGQVPVFIGALLGALLVFVFSFLAIRAMGRVAQTVIQRVRRQFRENPGIMNGTSEPDYGQCVDIVTQGALKAMILPGLLVVLGPVIVGVLFKQLAPATDGTPMGARAVAAMLIVGTITGILMAMFMNNAGGPWDNAKKYTELGAHGGKDSEAHKASVVGDTFEDTAGPSIHVLIKLLATIALVAAPLFL